jgi:UDP-2,4-diacetamido-2,4,6-trideoxy-beta-L-altropyranose hydrolase
MNIFIRVDTHIEIGIGHIYRCLKLLSYLEEEHNIVFICKKYNNLNSDEQQFMDNIYNKIRNKYLIKFIEIENDSKIKKDDMKTWMGEDYKLDASKTIYHLKNCNILIVDHYAIDFNWESLVKNSTEKLIIIEDFIGRKHNCDIIINGIVNEPLIYKELVNKDCKLFLGNEYLIVGNQFFNQDITLREKNRISIFISGSDNTNETCKIINNIKEFNKNNKYNFDIIVGGLNPCYKDILNLCTEDYFKVYYNIDNIAEIFNKSYISIGAIGQGLLERIALKIPSIIISLTENQLLVSKDLINSECFEYMGNIPIDYSKLINKIEHIEHNYNNIILKCEGFFKYNKLKNII